MSRWDIQQRFTTTAAHWHAGPLARCQPSHANGGLTDKLVGGDPDRDGDLQLGTYLTTNACSDVLRRTEQTAGAGEVEECVTIAARLDSWGVDPQNFVQRT